MSMNRQSRRANKNNKIKSTPHGKGHNKPLPASPLDKKLEEGRAFVKKGQYAEATKIFADILRDNPTHIGTIEELGLIAFYMEDYKKAISFFEGMFLIDPNNRKANGYLGTVYSYMEDYRKAIEYWEKSLKDSNRGSVHQELGNAYLILGDNEKAEHHLKTAHEMDPDDMIAFNAYFHRFGKIKSKNDPRFLTLLEFEKKYKNGKIKGDGAWMVNSLLFIAYDSLGEYEKAFDYSLKAGDIRKAGYNYHDYEYFVRRNEKIRTTYTKEFFDTYENVKIETSKPTFVFGMPRSGTTLLEQILHAHPDIEGIGEDQKLIELIAKHAVLEKENRSVSLNTIGKEYLAHINQKAPNAKRVANKAVNNFVFTGVIVAAFTDAKMIHIKRNAMDSCLSSFTKMFQSDSLDYTYDLQKLGEVYKLYVELMDYWNEVLPGQILNVNYEDIVNNIETEARRIIDFLELPWDDNCLKFYESKSIVRTASVTQVRQPIYKSAVGRWKKYGPKVIPLIEALGHAAPPEAIEYLEKHKKS